MIKINITYKNKSGDEGPSLNLADVKKIIFGNGRVFGTSKVGQLPAGAQSDEQPDTSMEDNTPAEEPGIRVGGYLDSWIRFGVYGGLYLFNEGDIVNKEDKLYKEDNNIDSNDNTVITSDGDFYGFEFAFLLPSIKFTQRRGFSLTGLKFGLKGQYEYSNVYCYYGDYNGTLMKFNSIEAGPEMNLVFSPRNDVFNVVVRIYTVAGKIFNGKLTAGSCLRDQGFYLEESQTDTGFSGSKLTAGVDAHFILNKGFPVDVGIGCFISESYIRFDKKVQVYNNAKKTSFSGNGLLVSAGVHL